MNETPIETPQIDANSKQPRDRNGVPICGKKGRSGPPVANRNALRHGLKSGKMPAEMKYLEPRINRLRVSLENAIVAIRGEVTTPEAGLIQTCMRWEAHACKAHHWLRVHYNELKPLEKLQFSREIAKGSTERDKSIKELCIDKASVQNDSLENLYADPILIDNRDKK